MDIRSPWLKGYDAFKDGESRCDNPYNVDIQPISWSEWANGWDQASKTQCDCQNGGCLICNPVSG